MGSKTRISKEYQDTPFEFFDLESGEENVIYLFHNGNKAFKSTLKHNGKWCFFSKIDIPVLIVWIQDWTSNWTCWTSTILLSKLYPRKGMRICRIQQTCSQLCDRIRCRELDLVVPVVSLDFARLQECNRLVILDKEPLQKIYGPNLYWQSQFVGELVERDPHNGTFQDAK